MTTQEAFDKIVRHLLTQNAAAIDKANSCFYRTPSGLKCAVGCLIPDEVYFPQMEGKLIQDVRSHDHRVAALFEGVPNGFLSAAQGIHDRLPVADWRVHLERLADEFNLSKAVFEEFPGVK